MLKKLTGLSGKPFLGDEIDQLAVEVIQKRFIQAALMISAAAFPITAAFVPNQPQPWKLGQLGLGSLLGLASAYVSKQREEGEIRYESNLKLNRSVYKHEVTNRYAKEQMIGDVARDASVKRALVQSVDAITLHGVFAYAERFGLPQGLFSDLVPAQPPASEDEVKTARELKNIGIASPNQDLIDTHIDKTAAAVIRSMAAKYPDYVRIDGRWVLELIESSTEHKMGKRANHHFLITAETQAGKSTLAGVLARGIAQRSQAPAVVAGHDAKKIPGMKDITKWLCQFTEGYKIDGYVNSQKWATFLSGLMDEQFELGSEAGVTMEGVRELVIIQDELNTIFGGGKGLPGKIEQKTAEMLQGIWLYLVTNYAGLKTHGIFMGQSPLSGDTGFSRPSLKNLCFIAMGQNSSYILDNPKNFLSHTNDEVLKVLSTACEMFEKEELRYALVRPTRGNAYVAIIPEFDTEGILNGNLDSLDVDSEEVVDDDEPETVAPQKAPVAKVETQSPKVTAPWETTPPPASESSDVNLIFAKMKSWIEECYLQYGRYPRPEHIKQVWEAETKTILSETTLQYLLEKLNLR